MKVDILVASSISLFRPAMIMLCLLASAAGVAAQAQGTRTEGTLLQSSVAFGF